MKILFLTNVPAPYRRQFFEELGKRCSLTVLYERRRGGDREESWFSQDPPRHYREVFLKGVNQGYEAAFCPGALNYLKDPSWDIIVVGGYSTPTGMLSIEYLRRRRRPFLLNCDGGQIKPDPAWKYKLKRRFLSAASAWLSPSRDTTAYLIHYGAVADKVFSYPFTSLFQKDILEIPPKKEDKDAIRRRLGISEQKVIISVGRFIFCKGYDVLLEACRSIPPDTGVYIIGGVPTEEYTAIRERNGLRHVHFVDFQDKDALRLYYQAADLFVLPTRGDVWGLVVNEAMACALPVITTESCGAGLELVKPGVNGLLVPPDQPEALARAIGELMQDTQTLVRMGRRSLEIIGDYTFENMARVNWEIFLHFRNQEGK